MQEFGAGDFTHVFSLLRGTGNFVVFGGVPERVKTGGQGPQHLDISRDKGMTIYIYIYKVSDIHERVRDKEGCSDLVQHAFGDTRQACRLSLIRADLPALLVQDGGTWRSRRILWRLPDEDSESTWRDLEGVISLGLDQPV